MAPNPTPTPSGARHLPGIRTSFILATPLISLKLRRHPAAGLPGARQEEPKSNSATRCDGMAWDVPEELAGC